ncbi:hypothetical protein [Bradyrhizobium sp. Tv2a-2]|uniref:DUF5983 family protein n=1 Tax=Bradyrhizobium sp. Tv2a-2 TaxID=113395 RepID=UPI0004076510|nr:hypothetical protein [Bradyrhizobium sp. Tv2a-2]
MSHPNLQSFMDLSTAHLKPSTREWLDSLDGQDNLSHWVAQTPYGWFLYCDEENGDNSFPDDLFACFTYARENGAAYILFDGAADAVADLPTYEDD